MADERAPTPGIYVIAGCNGAGKSSILGEALRDAGLDSFDPDRAARQLMSQSRLSQREANAAAWNEGRRLLERTIDARGTFAFETTLGGTTMTALLRRAASLGIPVHVWFVGLASAQMHVDRVRRRVAKGGHDIPVATIRKRYLAGPANLIGLLPGLAQLYLYDNSAEGDPHTGAAPALQRVMRMVRGRIVEPRELKTLMAGTSQWARPIVAAALKLHVRA